MDIRQKQSLLSYFGMFEDNTANNIDGKWGLGSQRATRKFQRTYGLPVDGVFGPATERKARDVIGNSKEKDEDPKPITPKDPDKQSGDFWDTIKYFKREEFACKCHRYCNGYPVEMNETVVRVLDRLREHYGVPVIVSSGIRCERHNANVGGVSNSRHKLGKAIDFTVRGHTASEVIRYVQAQPEIRYTYAINSRYVHMDVL